MNIKSVFIITLLIFINSWAMEIQQNTIESEENSSAILDFVDRPSQEQIENCRENLNEIGFKGSKKRLSALKDIIYELKDEKEAAFAAEIIIVASYSKKDPNIFRLDYKAVLELLLQMLENNNPNIKLLTSVLKSLPNCGERFNEEPFQNVFIKLLIRTHFIKNIEQISKDALAKLLMKKIKKEDTETYDKAFKRHEIYYKQLYTRLKFGVDFNLLNN